MVIQALPTAVGYPMPTSEQPRLQRYREARDFYEGNQWLGQRRRNETRLTFNYARRLLQTKVSYMFAEAVTFDVPVSAGESDRTVTGEAQSTPADLAELVLADYLEVIGADELDNQLALEASIIGDAAVKVTWDPVAMLPVVTAVDAAALRVTTRPDQPKVPLAWHHYYAMTASELAAALPEHAQRIFAIPAAVPGSMSQQPIVETWTNAIWELTFAGQLVVQEANPYGWMPYVAIANNPTALSFWGSSDLRDLFDVCREMNARYSVLADVLNLSGFPIAVLENIDGSEDITVAPGAKWEIPEDAKAYLLDLLSGGGVQLHIDELAEVRRAMHDLSETPRTSFGDSGRTISGAALEVEIQPLVQKVRRARRAFDRYHRERNARLLDLAEKFGGHALDGIRRVKGVWPAILPNDADALALRLSTMTGSDNLAHRTAMAAWGVEDPEGEWLRLIEEKTAVVATEPDPEPFGGEGKDDAEGDNDAEGKA